ncbi:basic salivary proline-rich protein 3 isoform X1 [Manihot esculenta]|uniref:RanBP2-type domain-containing protein n=3 Tax=Manihot esculenta TaxID=3983 RepID=A0A2C9W3W9_MANES|nr:basic salivary proline-rich protein 3 isoform X1 [Manihot esculenta]OAY53780.1 hypothetical protein MANES_03G023100v8 [Manihot esculenta]
MGSRDKDQTTSHHQPLLSSLVVRPSVSDGGDGGGGGRAAGSDYEPGEVRREPLPYSRSDRYSDDPGYRMHAGSGSPARRRDADHRYSSDFDHSGGPPRGREFGGGRDPGRFRDSSPPYARGRVGGRAPGRGFEGPGFGPGPFRGEGVSRNNPNVRPREGDWICSDPLCGNLNFARREYCNNCKRPRYSPGGSPRRGYPGPPPPHAPPRRFPGPPLDISPVRTMNGYRSPPRGWARDGPRDFGPGGPPPARHGGRFPDHDVRRVRPDYPDDDYRGRNKFDRAMPVDWGHRDRGRDNFFNDRKGFERRLPSPPPPPPPPGLPQRGRWGRDVRERSRSPIRGGPLVKEYRRDMYMERGRDDRRGMGRDRMGDVY